MQALAFDIFGTVVDWRSGIARAAEPVLAALGRSDIAPAAFADAWRARYQPAMAACRNGTRPYVRLDVLNRETLEALLGDLGIAPRALGDAGLHDLAMAWRRLDPWPDAVAGLARLRTRFTLVTLSNGNLALTTALVRHGALPFDAVMGAELTRAYKPLPAAYLGTAEILGIAPADLGIVAAHHSDLAAARGCGLRTAYVARPQEYGGRAAPDADQAQDWDHAADSLTQLADRLGC